MKPHHAKYILENMGQKSIEIIAKDLGIKERKIKRFLESQQKDEKQRTPAGSGVGQSGSVQISCKKRNIILSAILIAALGFFTYANSISGQFLWDDNLLVKDNLYIRDWTHLPQIFTQSIGAGSGIKYYFYRPVQMLTYMMDYSLWKLDARGYHLTGILLHIFAALSVYFLSNTIFNDNLLSLFAAAFFVVHPVHTEAVAYIAGRADSLALLFMMLCFSFYFKRLSSGRSGPYVLMLVSYALALLSKANSLILPGLVLLYHHSYKVRMRGKDFFSLVGLSLVYLFLRTTVLKESAPLDSYPTALWERIPGVFAALTNYIRLIFFPFDLHMGYGSPLFRWSDPKVISGMGIVSLFLFFLIKARNKSTPVFFSLSWFLAALLPVSNLYPINAYMAEHWLYLPSVGMFFLWGYGIIKLRQIKAARMPTVFLAIGLLVFYSWLTVKNNAYWRTPLVFFERLVKYAPNSARAHVELGLIYNSMGKENEAEAMLKKAIALKPDYAEAYNSLGAAYDQMGRTAEALAMFEKAVHIDPDYPRAYNNLAIFHYYHQNYKLAIEYSDQAKRRGFVNPLIEGLLEPYREK